MGMGKSSKKDKKDKKGKKDKKDKKKKEKKGKKDKKVKKTPVQVTLHSGIAAHLLKTVVAGSFRSSSIAAAAVTATAVVVAATAAVRTLRATNPCSGSLTVCCRYRSASEFHQWQAHQAEARSQRIR